MQTFTALDLDGNHINEQKAQHLANALQQNKVRSSNSHPIIQSLFPIDTHRIESFLQSNR
jgi:hypothetical protein